MGFSPICDPPRFFFQTSGSVTFVPLWCPNLTSCKKLEKTNERSLRYLKTDKRTADTQMGGPRTRAITEDPSGKPWDPISIFYLLVTINFFQTENTLITKNFRRFKFQTKLIKEIVSF